PAPYDAGPEPAAGRYADPSTGLNRTLDRHAEDNSRQAEKNGIDSARACAIGTRRSQDLDPGPGRPYGCVMKRIHYASGTLVTGDAIADVLMRYAASLAANNAAADVHAPALLESGQLGDVQLLLGPASQILAEDEQCESPE